MVFFLSLASFWPLWAAEANKVIPDGCPDLSGTYFCDTWSVRHSKQLGHFQSFENTKHKNGTTLYKIEKYRPGQEAEKETSYLVANGEKIERTTAYGTIKITPSPSAKMEHSSLIRKLTSTKYGHPGTLRAISWLKRSLKPTATLVRM